MLKLLTMASLSRYRDKDATIAKVDIVYQVLKLLTMASLPRYRDNDATIVNFNIGYVLLKFQSQITKKLIMDGGGRFS